MIDLYYAPTPNGWKISIMLEECGIPYRIIPVSLREGEQLLPAFLELNPNGRIPAMVDTKPGDGGEPVTVFETGAMLLYLAEKSGRFMPSDLRERYRVMQWLMWQMGGLGPMLGQHGHFQIYAPEPVPYAQQRYEREARRLYRVLDGQLGRTGDYVAGEYSIADMACFPWIMTHKAQGLSLDDFPNVKRWYAQVRARPAVQKALEYGKDIRKEPIGDDTRRSLFGIDTDAGR